MDREVLSSEEVERLRQHLEAIRLARVKGAVESSLKAKAKKTKRPKPGKPDIEGLA